MIRGREDTEGARESESIVLDYIASTPNASPADIARLIDDTGADLSYVANVLGIPPDVAQNAYDQAIQTAPPIKDVIDKQANSTPIRPPRRPLKDVIQPPDPRDPFGDAKKLFDAGKPVPQELQRMVFQKAGADGLNATKLAETLGVDRGLVEQAANNLGISQQLPSGFFAQEGGASPATMGGPGRGINPELQGGGFGPGGLPLQLPTGLGELTPEQQQQMDQDFRMFGPNRATGLQIPGFDDQGNPLPGYDDQGNRLAPGENNASIPQSLVPNAQDPTGGATGISLFPDSGAAPQTPQFTQEQIDTAVANLNSGAQTIEEVAKQYNVSPEFVRTNLAQINAQNQTTADINDPNLRRDVQTGGMAGPQLPVGLAAAEQAATGGAGQATNILGQAGMAAGQELTQGTLAGMGALRAGTGQARQDLMQGTLGGLNALSAGLAGARGDISGGAQAGLQALGQGLGAARQDITGGTQAGLQALYQGLGGARTDLSAAQQAAAEQFGAGMGDITAARDLASQQVGQAFGGAQQRFDPYSQIGQQALGQQAALSGALGQEAFQQAYQDSPQMQFLREQGEKAALRTAAARGGLGGGNVMKELARFSTGLASQDLQRQIQNLQALGGQGLQAAGQQARLGAQAGQTQAGLQTDAARQLAAQRGQIAASQLSTGQQMAGLGTAAGQAGLGALTQAGQQLGQLGVTGGTQGLQTLTGTGQQLGQLGVLGGTTGFQALQGQGQQLANLAQQLGVRESDLLTGLGAGRSNIALGIGTRAADLAAQTGMNLAGMRTRAGEQLAGQFGTAASQLANLQQAQGAGTADMIGAQTNYMNQLQAAAAQGDAAAQTELARLQSGINMNIGQALAGVPGSQYVAPPNAAGSILQGAALGYEMGQNISGGGSTAAAPVTTSQPAFVAPTQQAPFVNLQTGTAFT